MLREAQGKRSIGFAKIVNIVRAGVQASQRSGRQVQHQVHAVQKLLELRQTPFIHRAGFQRHGGINKIVRTGQNGGRNPHQLRTCGGFRTQAVGGRFRIGSGHAGSLANPIYFTLCFTLFGTANPAQISSIGIE